MVWLLLNSASAVSRVSLLLPVCLSLPCSEQVVGRQGVRKGHRRDSGPKVAEEILHSTKSCSAIKLGVEEESKKWDGVVFKGGCCLGTGWAWICLWEVVRDCLCITSLPRAVFISTHGSSCFHSYSLPCPTGEGGGSEQAAVWVLSCWPR